MKTYIFFLYFIFLSCLCYGQKDEPWSLKDDFQVTNIDSLKTCYLVKAINKNNLEILIYVPKPKRKIIRGLKKDINVSLIEKNVTYFFNLESMTQSIGYLPTEKIIMDGTEIWDRSSSNFFVYKAENLEGLFYIK